ncbi:MAG: hypothetical protein RJB45_580, partial [Pseudomonadota bacterium]
MGADGLYAGRPALQMLLANA